MTEFARIEIKRGSLYVLSADCARFFPEIESIILLRDGRDLLIAPVRYAAAGGYILKIRNSVGDRVAVAPDFFRANDFDDRESRVLLAEWDHERAALRAAAVFNN
jgi:hypothetical protein